MSKQTDFIKTLSEIVRAEYLSRSKWVLPSVCIAQAALESGWNLKAKTLFGIKGKGISAKTQEFINGKMINVVATFQAYPSLAASVDGYFNLITKKARYAGAVNNPNYRSAIIAIKAGGYATDPDYVNKIISIIEKYNLTKFDARETTKKETSAPKQPDITSIAQDVIRGKYGNGAARKASLEAAGYDYLKVQAEVNRLLKARK